MGWRLLASVLLVTLGLFVAPAPSAIVESGGTTEPGSHFEFALIGDLGYTPNEQQEFANLMAHLDPTDLAFVVHVGDFKGGGGARAAEWALCSDELFAIRLEQFQSSTHPFIYTPGDNDWTDCHRPDNGPYDPLERLATLRGMFFPGTESLGQRKIQLSRQSDNPTFRAYRENVRWAYRGVTFAAIHVVGSNNNLGREPEADAEHFERNAANIAWLRESLAEARRMESLGIVLFMQANPGFERPAEQRTGFNEFLAALEEETLGFDRPVALLHGDTHYFRVDKPLRVSETRRQIQHFIRVETFGSPEHHWVRVIVDSDDPNLFRFEPVIVPDNVPVYIGQ